MVKMYGIMGNNNNNNNNTQLVTSYPWETQNVFENKIHDGYHKFTMDIKHIRFGESITLTNRRVATAGRV